MTRTAALAGAGLTFALMVAAQELYLAKVEQVAHGFTFTEGVAWNAKDGHLIFSDTPADRLIQWTPGHGTEVYRTNAHGPCGNAFDAEGRLYTCETRSRTVTRTDRNGKIETLASVWEGKKLNAPAHIAVSRNDHVYFTDPAFGFQSDRRELDFYGVYHLPPKGPLKLVAKSQGRPNGIALSPNGKILYVTNSDEHNVRAYDVDRNGEASNERVLIAGIPAVPGGMTVDEKGNLIVAAKGVAIFSPAGKPLPGFNTKEMVSSCAFGDADGKSLMLTARGMIYRVRFDQKDGQ